MTGHHVVVLLPSRLAALEQHGTRWRAVLSCWAADPRVGRLDVLDYIRFGARAACLEQPSWLAGARSWRVTVPGRRRSTPLDAAGWLLASRAVRRALPCEPGSVVVTATPLALPLALRLPGRHGFDAVDDWRVHDAATSVRRRVAAGYALLGRTDVVTSVSPALAGRLPVPGVHVVPNGVDLAAYAGFPEPPVGLPAGPFAVYVGSVQSRVDLTLLAELVRRVPGLPVVVAGPADLPTAAALTEAGVQWLGPVPVGQVPGLLRRAAVGLIPHRVDALTDSMDPMKVLEYLAAGLPVVATPVPLSVSSLRLHRAATAEEFAAAVRAAAATASAPGPDPSVLDRDWTVVSDRLLELHVGLCR